MESALLFRVPLRLPICTAVREGRRSYPPSLDNVDRIIMNRLLFSNCGRPSPLSVLNNPRHANGFGTNLNEFTGVSQAIANQQLLRLHLWHSSFNVYVNFLNLRACVLHYRQATISKARASHASTVLTTFRALHSHIRECPPLARRY